MMLFISFPAMTMMNSVSGHINVMHLIVFCGILNNKDDLGHGQFMGIGRRLRGWGEVGWKGPIAFGSSARSSRWVAATLFVRLSHKDDGRRPMRLNRQARNSQKIWLSVLFELFLKAIGKRYDQCFTLATSLQCVLL